MSWYKSSLLLLAIVGCAEAPDPAHEVQGDRSMRTGRYGEAATHYQRAVDQNAKSAVLYRKLAEAHAKNEALPAAVRTYEQAITLAPSHAKTRTELAILLTRLDRYDDALALLEQTVREHPDRAQAHLVLGLLHAREGRYPAAITAYQRAIAAVPSYGEAWFNLGEAHIKQNDYAAAEQAFSSAVAADTTSAQFRNGLGRSYYLRRDYAAAVAEFGRAVRLDSLFAQARFNLGNALLRSGQKEEGRRQLALYKRLDDEEERIAMLKNTLATHPDDAGAYHDLAVVYGQRGQYRDARIRYLQALDRDPRSHPRTTTSATSTSAEGKWPRLSKDSAVHCRPTLRTPSRIWDWAMSRCCTSSTSAPLPPSAAACATSPTTPSSAATSRLPSKSPRRLADDVAHLVVD